MSLTSGFRVDRSSRALAYVTCFLELAYFCAVSALCFLGATLLCAALAAAAGKARLSVPTELGAWWAAAPAWVYLLVVLGYPLLVMVYWLPAEKAEAEDTGVALGAWISFAKAAIFGAISAAYFLGGALLYAAIAQKAGSLHLKPFFNAGSWFAALPGWMHLVLIWAYLLGVLVYFSRVRLAGTGKLRAVSGPLVGKVVIFCGLSAAYFIAVAGVHASILQWRGDVKLEPFARVGAWFSLLPGWMYVAMAAAYAVAVVLLCLLRARASVREVAGLLLAPLVPFLKTGFFCALSAAYFAGAAVLYLLLAPGAGIAAAKPAPDSAVLLAEAPKWVFALVGAAYLLLVTVYWAPREDGANQIEVRAFTVFLAAALGAAGYFLIRRVAALPFWKDFTPGP